jgi:hypothetical protein
MNSTDSDSDGSGRADNGDGSYLRHSFGHNWWQWPYSDKGGRWNSMYLLKKKSVVYDSANPFNNSTRAQS